MPDADRICLPRMTKNKFQGGKRLSCFWTCYCYWAYISNGLSFWM